MVLWETSRVLEPKTGYVVRKSKLRWNQLSAVQFGAHFPLLPLVPLPEISLVPSVVTERPLL